MEARLPGVLPTRRRQQAAFIHEGGLVPGVRMIGISKYYATSGVQANDGVTLTVENSKIHALVGENGAGKSTLMRILYGLEHPDAGRIFVGGEEVVIDTPARSARLGIGMVHQHFTTVPDFTVAENVVLGSEPRRWGFFFDAAKATLAAASIIAENGFHLDPAQLAGELSVGERQQLEIAKLLYRKADILILDEPSSVLAEQEIHSLFATLRRLRDSGKTIVMITHKVREVKEIADSVTVMRGGRTIDRFETSSVDENELACLMMGTTSCTLFSRDGPALHGDTVFELRDVVLSPKGYSRAALDHVSLSVSSGEILGVCGVAGNGLVELENVASGLTSPASGLALLKGKPLPPRRKPGLGYVPADRMYRGACLDASVEENLASLDRGTFFPRGFVDTAATRQNAGKAIQRFSIKAKPESRTGSLSGGTIQKVILARELRADASFILFSDPTWGLDVASTEFTYERILEARNAGAGVLLISSNLDEILTLCDRIMVMYKGRVVCSLDNGNALDREGLGEYMLGLKDDFNTAGEQG
jgi:general nucleoside transport system ATP-binding protein